MHKCEYGLLKQEIQVIVFTSSAVHTGHFGDTQVLSQKLLRHFLFSLSFEKSGYRLSPKKLWMELQCERKPLTTVAQGI